VKIARRALDQVIAHARETQPAECCGILLGSPDDIVRAVRATNLSADPSRYEIDPRDHIAARREARASGEQIVGFYHSHPHSAPDPSETDLSEATYHDALYLIVGCEHRDWAARLFRFGVAAATQVELSIY
jgi:proteasome lid subunit RPN8/RPN11